MKKHYQTYFKKIFAPFAATANEKKEKVSIAAFFLVILRIRQNFYFFV